jgi:uncharacterized protein (DUF305 family)
MAEPTVTDPADAPPARTRQGTGPSVTKRKATPPPAPATPRWSATPGRLVAMGVAVLVLGVGLGMVVQSGSGGRPSVNAVDVGFLQDMRTHHDQAVQMSLIFVSKSDVNATLRQVATEILLGQQFENGAFVQLLDDAGKPTVNDTDVAMAWMGMAMKPSDMPGIASDDDITTLRDAKGSAADHLFAALMIAHHEGGIDMAKYAKEHGHWGKVRSLSASIVITQTGEVNDLTRIQGTLP